MKTITLKSITLSIFTLFMAATLLVSCGKSKDNPSPVSSGSHQIVYKATATDGTVNIVDYTIASGDQTTITSLNTATWSSDPITVPTSIGSVVFAVTGHGNSPSSTITVQIYVDGVLKKTNTGQGTSLSAGTDYTF